MRDVAVVAVAQARNVARTTSTTVEMIVPVVAEVVAKAGLESSVQAKTCCIYPNTGSFETCQTKFEACVQSPIQAKAYAARREGRDHWSTPLCWKDGYAL